jgi:hypothetical protein
MSPLEWYHQQAEPLDATTAASDDTTVVPTSERENTNKSLIRPESDQRDLQEIPEISLTIPEDLLFESSEGNIFFGEEEEEEKNIPDEGGGSGGLRESQGNTGVLQGNVQESVRALREIQGDPLTRDERPWVSLAEQVLAGRFERADRSTTDSLRIGLSNINHPRTHAALAMMTRRARGAHQPNAKKS